MAREQHLGASEEWFIGEDKTIPFEIYSSDEATMQDVAGWALEWRLRKMIDSDAVLLTRTTGGSTITISGTYNAVPATNTQRINVLIEDTDTDNLQPGNYQYALKRTTAGSETILAYGTVTLKKAAL